MFAKPSQFRINYGDIKLENVLSNVGKKDTKLGTCFLKVINNSDA